MNFALDNKNSYLAKNLFIIQKDIQLPSALIYHLSKLQLDQANLLKKDEESCTIPDKITTQIIIHYQLMPSTI